MPEVLFSIALSVVAAAYAAVGQGGATGYIAVMGLVGFGPDVIRPAALTLNMLVSAIGTVQFARAGLGSGVEPKPIEPMRGTNEMTMDEAWKLAVPEGRDPHARI